MYILLGFVFFFQNCIALPSYRIAIVVDKVDNANFKKFSNIFNSATSNHSRSTTSITLPEWQMSKITHLINKDFHPELEMSLIQNGPVDEMYENMFKKNTTFKPLIAIIDMAQCTGQKCEKLEQIVNFVGNVSLFTSCCYIANHDQVEPGRSLNQNWPKHLASVGPSSNTIYSGIHAVDVGNFANALSHHYHWDSFMIFMSPQRVHIDRFASDMLQTMRQNEEIEKAQYILHCSKEMKAKINCQPLKQIDFAWHWNCYVMFAIFNDQSEVDFFINFLNNDHHHQDKVVILVDIDSFLTENFIDKYIRAGIPPNHLMILTKNHNGKNVNNLKFKRESEKHLRNLLTELAKSIDFFAQNLPGFSKLSALFCNSVFQHFENESVFAETYGNTCHVDTHGIEVWSIEIDPNFDPTMKNNETAAFHLEKAYFFTNPDNLTIFGFPKLITGELIVGHEHHCIVFAGTCFESLNDIIIGLVTGCLAFVIASIALGLVSFYYVKKAKLLKKRALDGLVANFDEIEVLPDDKQNQTFQSVTKVDSRMTMMSFNIDVRHSTRRQTSIFQAFQFLSKPGKMVKAKFRGDFVSVFIVQSTGYKVNNDILTELNMLKKLTHTNVSNFIGLTTNDLYVCAIYEHCEKGPLTQILNRKSLPLNRVFKVSFLHDIAEGLRYIHESAIGSHGNLNIDNILVDCRWFCNISNFPMPTEASIALKNSQALNILMKIPQHEFANPEGLESSQINDSDPRGDFWMAPELLRLPESVKPIRGTKQGDVYSFGMIAFAIATRTMPFENDELPDRLVVSRIKNGKYPPYRPTCRGIKNLPTDIDDILDLFQTCTDEVSTFRPTTPTVLKMIETISKGKDISGELVDEMIATMEKYASDLEMVVSLRTKQLANEQAKSDELLSKMLPRSIIDELKRGGIINPESFDLVTIYFSDIVGFTELAMESSALEIITFLNDIYSMFDHVIDLYNVYKVETIGDAYMVASGLPIRHETNCSEIATMALDILSRVPDFKIQHREGMVLQLRCGFHSGPVVAGVVGLTMPRYCLFGDTVNYASRMQSSGFALRIHVSTTSKEILDQAGGFHLEKRGLVTMKGKGSVETYWLIGKDGFDKPMPDLSLAASLEAHKFK